MKPVVSVYLVTQSNNPPTAPKQAMACSSNCMSWGCSVAVLVLFLCSVVAFAAAIIMQIMTPGSALPSAAMVRGYRWIYFAGLILALATIVTSYSCQWAKADKCGDDCTCGSQSEDTAVAAEA